MLMPRLEKSVEEWFDTVNRRQPQGAMSRRSRGRPRRKATPRAKRRTATPRRTRKTLRQDDSPLAVTGLLKKLLRFDFDGAVRQSLRNAARDAALAAVRTLLGSVVRTLVFVLCFLVFTAAAQA